MQSNKPSTKHRSLACGRGSQSTPQPDERAHPVTKSEYERSALRAYQEAERLRAKAKRACTLLTSEGFTIVRNTRQLGNTLFIEVKYPARTASNYEQYLREKVELAQRCLWRS